MFEWLTVSQIAIKAVGFRITRYIKDSFNDILTYGSVHISWAPNHQGAFGQGVNLKNPNTLRYWIPIYKRHKIPHRTLKNKDALKRTSETMERFLRNSDISLPVCVQSSHTNVSFHLEATAYFLMMVKRFTESFIACNIILPITKGME